MTYGKASVDLVRVSGARVGYEGVCVRSSLVARCGLSWEGHELEKVPFYTMHFKGAECK